MTHHTMSETAQILKISYRTIQRLIENKQISYHKVNRIYWFTDEDIQEFINKSQVKAGA